MLVLTYFRNLFLLVVGGRQDFRWRALVGGGLGDGWCSLLYVSHRLCALRYAIREPLVVRVANFAKFVTLGAVFFDRVALGLEHVLGPLELFLLLDLLKFVLAERRLTDLLDLD